MNDLSDLYLVDELLTPEETAVRDRVRNFAETEALPLMADHFDRGEFPMRLIGRMAQMGLFGVHVQGYGCKTTNHSTYGLICRELSRCDSGLRAMFSVQNSLVMFPIFAFGSEDQRRRWLPGMARGEVLGCFGLSESGFGSNPGGMQTRAEMADGHYILNGSKMWITNGPIAQVALIWARLGEEIRGFLVPTDTPGIRITPIRRKFAYRTSPTAAIALTDCEVPADGVLPGATGLKPVFECLNQARYGVACGATGSAIACLEAARGFARRRQVFGRPIGGYQLIQDQLARMLVEITKAQLLDFRLGRLLDEGRATAAQISLAKLNNVREALTIARAARDILGARGILADYHVMRHLCDLEAVSTLEGTAGMHTLVIGQAITGIAAFK